MPTKKRRNETRDRSLASPTRRSTHGLRRPLPASRYAVSSLIEARNSRIHGRGVYAVAPIKKGTRIIEYLGERISHAEADRRYALKGDDDGHTFLFIATSRTVIDASKGGNDARFVNHSCAPNCETVIEGGRVFVYAIRNIKPGEELGYDYQLTWESTDTAEELALYNCCCGARKCRGTMLDSVALDKKNLEKKNLGKKKKK
jgi:SET domain-containing protein